MCRDMQLEADHASMTHHRVMGEGVEGDDDKRHDVVAVVPHDLRGLCNNDVAQLEK